MSYRINVINGATMDSGPYEAIVVGHLDPKFMGGLLVELVKKTDAGNSANYAGQAFEALYLSPFAGTTSLSGDVNSYEYVQKSYGMWFVPPDLGTRVLVTFAEGNTGKCFWLGSVMDEHTNFMIPGHASSTFASNASTKLSGKKVPTAEYSKNSTTDTSSRRPTVFGKPIHTEFLRTLIKSGLLDDEIRGTTTSSARREVPSSVFGINTPGPIDKSTSSPKKPQGVKSNNRQHSAPLQPTNRLGGSSFVMDDGDDKILRKGSPADTLQEYANVERGEKGGDTRYPQNELFRLKTRTGHQIVMHNTEDLIYISNARGTSWVELSSNGKIDIYSEDSISVHSANDLNFTADRDVNFTANRNMNMVVGNEIRVDAGNSINTTSGSYTAFNASTSVTHNAGTYIAQFAKDSFTQVAEANNFTILSGASISIGAKAEIGIEAESNLKLYSDLDTNIVSKQSLLVSVGIDEQHNVLGDYVITVGPDQKIYHNSPAKVAAVAVNPAEPQPVVPVSPLRAAQVARVPEHEGWNQHENVDPLRFNRSKTEAGRQQTESIAGVTYDTFDTRTTPTEITTVSQSSASTPFDATLASRDIDTSNQTAYSGTPTTPLLAAGLIKGFTLVQTQAYLNALGIRESSNAYDAINSIGFVGRFQFGTAALKESGNIKLSASNSNKEMLNDDNWTGKDGVNSRDDWLSNQQAQENAVIIYTNKNRGYLLSKNGIRDGDNDQQIGGMLFGAHLLGAGGMSSWRRGFGGRDQYGTTGDEYFNLGSAAV